MTGLRVAPCSREAALFAVKCWHYSRCLPAGRALYFGAWCRETFEGVVIVSRGASQHIGSPFGLAQDRIAEVTRIALRPGHLAPVSQVLAVVCRLLRRTNPGLALLVSYSDPREGHDGRGVYAAAGWTYLGVTHKEATLRVHGKETHARTVSSRYGTRDLGWLHAHVDPQAKRILNPAKHKYVVALRPSMRASIAAQAKPYPTRAKATGTEGTPHGLGGVIPTRSLHPLTEGTQYVR